MMETLTLDPQACVRALKGAWSWVLKGLELELPGS